MKTSPWFILYQGKTKFAGIGRSVLAGAMLSIYDNREQAERAVYKLARRFKQPFLIRELEDPVSAAQQFAEDGYAGMLMNDRDPVNFLLDTDGSIVAVKCDEKNDHFLLVAPGQWQQLQDTGKYRPLDNFDAIDLRLRNSLGIEPFWGKEAHVGFTTLAHRDDMTRYYECSDSCEPNDHPLTNYLLFPGDKLVKLYRKKLAEPLRQTLDIVPVANVAEFVKQAWRSEHGVILNPDEHRALQGRFWVEGDSVFFESYAGAWRVSAADVFESVYLPYRTDRMLSRCAMFVLRQHGRLLHIDYDREQARVTLPIHVLGFSHFMDDESIRQLTVAVEKSLVEAGDFLPLATVLRDLIAAGNAARFKNGLAIKFYGYSGQKEAPFEMQGPRSWYTALFRECPWLTYFLMAEDDQLRSFVLALSPQTAPGDDGAPGEGLMQTILGTVVGGMRLAMLLGEEPGEVMEKVFEQFDLEPDADIYEDLLKKAGK